MSKVIGLQVRLEGDAADLKSLQSFSDALEDVAKQSARVKKLTDEISRLEKEVAKISKTKPNENLPGGKEAEKNIQTLAQLRAEMKRLASEGKSYEELARQAGKLKEEADQVNAAIRQQQQEFKALNSAAGSYRQLNAELVLLKNQFRELSEEERKGAIGKELVANIQRLDKELKTLDANIGQYQRNVGNYQSAFRGLAGIATQFGAILGVGVGIQELISNNTRLASSISDVQKTTGLAKDEARDLRDELAKIDTRTSLEGLLAIAEGAGRLGLGSLGVDGLTAFAESIDKVNVALGDVLEGDPDQIATDLAKLSSSFGTEDQFGVAGGIERIGAAINLLGSSTKANENFILQASKRLQGLAATAGIAAPEILGLTATLDELSLTQELSTSAVQRFVVGIASAPEQFAALAESVGVSRDSFIELTKTNPNEAILTVLEAAKSTETGLAGLNETLELLGITSVGEIQTITALANNIDKLRTNQGIANVEFAKTQEQFEAQNSLYDEFNTKNTDLAASVEKLKNAFVELVTRSQVQDFLQFVIEGISKLVMIFASLPKFVYENRAAFASLTVALIAFNFQAVAASANSIRAAFALLSYQNAVKAARLAQVALNAAMKANPIGFVIGIIALLVTGLISLYNSSETVRKSINDVWKQMVELYEQSGFARAVLFALIEPIRFLIDLFNNGFSGAVDNFKQRFSDTVGLVGESVNRMILSFQLLGLKIADSLSFGVTGLDNKIKDIESRIKESTDRSTKIALDAQKRRLEAQAKADKESAETSTKIADDQEKKETERTKRITEEQKKAAEQRAKDRLEAAKRIIDLENELIENAFDRRTAQATTSAQRDIAGLVGDPAQIERQTELIKQKLSEQLEAINEERRKAQDEALSLIAEYNQQVIELQTGGNVSGAEGQLSALESAFAIDTKKLQLNLQAARKLAIEQFEAGLLTEKQYQDRLLELQRNFDAASLSLFAESGAAELLLRQELAVQREAQLQAELEAELMAIEQARIARNEALAGEVEQGNLTEGQGQEGVQSSEELARQQQLEAEREFGRQIAEIRQETALQALEYQEEITTKELELAQDRQEQLLELDKKRRDIVIGYASEMSDAFAELLSGQVKDTKDFYKQILITTLDAIERIMLLYVAQATAVEVGTKGIAGIATSLIATAVIKGAIAGLKGIVANFEEGGDIGGSGSVAFDGGAIPSQGGMANTGDRHAQGGIKGIAHGVPIEIEQGEFVMRNGDMTHIVNRRASNRFKGALYAAQSAFPANAYSSRRANIARSINSFENGGTISSGITTPPLQAPVSASQVLGAANAQTGLTTAANQDAQVGMIMDMVEATNRRIDRLVVINDPAETVKYGNIEIRKVQNQQQ